MTDHRDRVTLWRLTWDRHHPGPYWLGLETCHPDSAPHRIATLARHDAQGVQIIASPRRPPLPADTSRARHPAVCR